MLVKLCAGATQTRMVLGLGRVGLGPRMIVLSGSPELSRHLTVILGGNRLSVGKSSGNYEGDSQRSEKEEDRLSLFTFEFMVTNFTPAVAKPFAKSVRFGTVSWYEVVRIW